MKTAISIPDHVFHIAETFAEHLEISRSALYTKAILSFMKAHRYTRVTEKLNAVYAKESSEIDPLLAELQSISLPQEENR
jgi:hypothetical protein